MYKQDYAFVRRFMHEQAQSAVIDGDVVLHLVDVTHWRQASPHGPNSAEGTALEEALAMAQDAIELVHESRHERGEPIPDDVGDPVVRKLTVAAAA